MCIRDRLYSDEEGKIYCITLSPQVEEIIRDGVQAGDRGAYLAIEPSVAQEIILSLIHISLWFPVNRPPTIFW